MDSVAWANVDNKGVSARSVIIVFYAEALLYNG